LRCIVISQNRMLLQEPLLGTTLKLLHAAPAFHVAFLVSCSMLSTTSCEKRAFGSMLACHHRLLILCQFVGIWSGCCCSDKRPTCYLVNKELHIHARLSLSLSPRPPPSLSVQTQMQSWCLALACFGLVESFLCKMGLCFCPHNTDETLHWSTKDYFRKDLLVIRKILVTWCYIKHGRTEPDGDISQFKK